MKTNRILRRLALTCLCVAVLCAPMAFLMKVSSGANSGPGGQTVWNFAATGAVQTVTLEPGVYELQAWGADGGNRGSAGPSQSLGGAGAYVTGVLSISTATEYGIFINRKGGSNTAASSGAGGGGATSIMQGGTAAANCVIVAGGGGGGGYTSTTVTPTDAHHGRGALGFGNGGDGPTIQISSTTYTGAGGGISN